MQYERGFYNRSKIRKGQNDVGITVMKPFAGGRLFDAKRSPFGVKISERMKKTAALFETY
ncbi:MAG: hypothetical protein ACOYBL_01455 [Lachnospiraceae bacterium]|jgi:hypothetical protein